MSKRSPFKHPGIYKITCLPTQEIYIGGSKCISRRWSTHRVKLRGGYHENPNLQARFYDYGEDSLCFEVLENLEGLTKLEIKNIESDYIQNLKPELNIITEPNLCWDIKGSKNHMAKMTESDVYLIRCCYSQYLSAKEIKEILGLPFSASSISDVCAGERWIHVFPDLKNLVDYKIITPTGEVIFTNYLQRLKDVLDISPYHLFRIASSFKDLHFHGYKCSILHLPSIELIKNPKLLTCKNTVANFWGILQDPTGQKHEVWALKNFCKRNKLDISSILRVARGEWSHHKGWTVVSS